jgi:YYY domain-containing protein
VVAAAAYLRFVGLNWDEFQHLHPDERFLTMVETGVRPVEGGWAEYFDSGNSTLNPHNQGYDFFVYGTVPIFLVRYLAQWIADTGLQLSDLGFESSLELGTGYDQVHLVGRAVSAFADTVSVLLLYFVGKLLYSRRVGLLAAALAAGSVALIQQAHFFTVDSLANLFVTLGMLFAARALHSDSPLNYALFGSVLGVAAASRINTAPLMLLILLAAWSRVTSRESWLTSYGWRVVLAAVLSLLVFRVAQPYAFAGPSFFDIGPNEQWLNNIREIRGQMRGDVDFPPNHQWTDRLALIFPWQNMVRWGMGPALGLAAWAGFGWAGWQLLRRQTGSRRHLLPVAWSGLYFLWQGTQWVKPMRYFLPIYPTLILLGAWALHELSKEKRSKHALRLASPGLIALVLGSTMLYALAFSRIYTRPVTRVAASRWIYENLPGPFSLVIETAEGAVTQPVRMPPDFQYENSQPHTQSFTAQASGVISALRIGHLGDANADAAPETFTVSIQDGTGGNPPGSATLMADLSANSGYTLQLQPPLSVTKGQNYQLVSQAVAGAPLAISGAQLANESSWDDGLPLRMDGYDGFSGIYGGHNLELYWEDDEAKRERMLDILAQSDYILISSNRQYGSIPRLHTRYPLTIAYYDALFSDELGFELAAEFESAPNLGSWQFSDQGAEEPFTVYDHPKVLIFRKAADFSIERVRDVLRAVDLSQVIWMNPQKATAAPTGLLLPPERLAEQRGGGTWSQMFDSSSALNRLQWLGAFAWWGGLLMLGWLLFPLTFLAFSGLPERGYAVSKILALLLIAWLAWLLASVHWAPFTRGTIGLLAGGLGLLAAGVAARRTAEMRRWIVAHRRYIISVELLWLALFLFDLFIRWHNPDLWHPTYGGEKPMDFSYFNAVLRSVSFPPFDPWLAGGYINYYYFGYVLAAVPTKLLGIAPAFAYNLLLPMLFAMTGTGAFCVAYNLSVSEGQRGAGRPTRVLSLWGGLAAAALMVLLGNLGQLDTIAKGLRKAAETAPHRLLPGMGAVSDWATGLYRVGFESQTIPMGTGEWYWNATRLIPHPESEAVPITEFPLFTFLYADLHAHMLALPLTLLALAWALAVVLGTRRSGDKPAAAAHWWVGALAIGALGPTNTWDLPTYLVLGCVAVVYAQFRRYERLDYDMFLAAAGRVALLVALAALFFRPYTLWYGSGYNAVELWRGSTTPLSAYLKIHGLFLFIIVAFLVAETRRWVQSTTIHGLRGMKNLLAVGIVMGVVLLGSTALLVFVGVQIAPLALGLLVWAILLLLSPQQTPQKRAALALVCLALLLTVLVELVRLEGDISRMNTVFKFYLQAWTLFSVAAGAGLTWVWQQMPDWQQRNTRLWWAGLGLLVLIAAAYTLLAASAKMRDRMAAGAPHTLDGMAFMQFADYHDQGQPIPLSPDYDAIRWLQENASGSPVIVEAHTSEYKYGSRYTMYTGLPGVVGWNWHQRQQRAVTPPNLITDRVDAVNRFYRETDNNAALAFLRRYDVRYIVVSVYERAYYPGEGLEKFGRMANAGLLDIAYDHGDVVIYAHNGEPVE